MSGSKEGGGVEAAQKGEEKRNGIRDRQRYVFSEAALLQEKEQNKTKNKNKNQKKKKKK